MTGWSMAPGEGERYEMIDGVHVAKAAVADDLGRFEVFEVDAPAGDPAPMHVSPWSGVYYVLSGRIRVRRDGEEREFGPGGLAVVPAGTPWTFAALGERARFLVITSGDAAGRFFADFADTVPADAPMGELFPAIAAVTARHGVAVLAG